MSTRVRDRISNACFIGAAILIIVGAAADRTCVHELPKLGAPLDWEIVRPGDVYSNGYSCPFFVAKVPEYSCVATHTMWQTDCKPVMTYYVKFHAARTDGTFYNTLYEVTTDRQRALDDCLAWQIEMQDRMIKAHEEKLQ